MFRAQTVSGVKHLKVRKELKRSGKDVIPTSDPVLQLSSSTRVWIRSLKEAKLDGLLVLWDLQAVPQLSKDRSVVVDVRHLHPHQSLGEVGRQPSVSGIDWRGDGSDHDVAAGEREAPQRRYL